MAGKQALKLLIKCRDECHERMGAIVEEKQSLNAEELIVSEKLEQLNRTIGLFAKEEELKSKKKLVLKGSSKRGCEFKSKDAGDIPVELFAAFPHPSWAATVCQDARGVLKLQRKHCSADQIASVMASKYEYARASTFRMALSKILKVARGAEGTWVKFVKEGAKYTYAHV